MKKLSFLLRRTAFAVALLVLVALARAQDMNAAFNFRTFSVPGATTLSVQSINDSGTISGYYADSAGDTISYLRTAAGTITTYTEPNDTTSPTFTEAGEINKNGAVAGEFFDTVLGTYIGYIYHSTTGKFVTYQAPGQPQFTTTGLVGISNKAETCGFILPPPYSLQSALITSGGTATVFSVNGSATTACYGINDSGTSVGFYKDSAGVLHGWMRTAAGTISTLDVPSAATTLGTAPCVSTPIAGTVPIGINNAGFVSGHYWDRSYNEHGFLMTPGGKFLAINAPGAYQTAGGGLNDKSVVVGHYVDSNCASTGYIASR